VSGDQARFVAQRAKTAPCGHVTSLSSRHSDQKAHPIDHRDSILPVEAGKGARTSEEVATAKNLEEL
jgi:hypothetical protein